MESPSYHIIFPRQWKVIQTGTEKVLLPELRDDRAAARAVPCAPRCFAGPSLLAMRRVYGRTAGVSSVMPRARHIKYVSSSIISGAP